MKQLISIAALAAALVLLGVAITPAQDDKPDLYVISIGINNYKHGLPGRIPTYAEKDARDFASAIDSVAASRFRAVHIYPLMGTEGNATLAGINAALLKVARQARPQDTFVFFYSGKGHSVDSAKDSQFYLYPSDMTAGAPVAKNALSASELEYWFLRIACHQQLIAFDSSKSSRGFEDFKERVDRENTRLARIAHRDMVLLTVKEWSFEFASLKNGLFTSMLLRAIKGGAANASGEIGARALADFVTKETPNVLARAATPKARTILRSNPASGLPYVYSSGDDFVIGSTKAPGAERPTDFQNAGFLRNGATVADYRQNPACTYVAGPAPANLHRKGKDLALLIAENNYDHWPKLRNPISDATAIADALSRRYGFQTELLTDATNACIDDAIDRYSAKQYAPDSQLLIYFAGHGVYVDTRHTSFLVPRDSSTLAADPKCNSCTLLWMLQRDIDALPANHILLVLDACQTSSIGQGSDAGGSGEHDATQIPAGESEDPELRMLAFRSRKYLSSSDKEYVDDGPAGGHSPFAEQLLSILKGGTGFDFLTYKDISSELEKKLYSPPPTDGGFGSDQRRGNFLFFVK